MTAAQPAIDRGEVRGGDAYTRRDCTVMGAAAVGVPMGGCCLGLNGLNGIEKGTPRITKNSRDCRLRSSTQHVPPCRKVADAHSGLRAARADPQDQTATPPIPTRRSRTTHARAEPVGRPVCIDCKVTTTCMVTASAVAQPPAALTLLAAAEAEALLNNCGGVPWQPIFSTERQRARTFHQGSLRRANLGQRREW
jgi:hypothetical protein